MRSGPTVLCHSQPGLGALAKIVKLLTKGQLPAKYQKLAFVRLGRTIRSQRVRAKCFFAIPSFFSILWLLNLKIFHRYSIFCNSFTQMQGTEVQVSSSFRLMVASKSTKAAAVCLHAQSALLKEKMSGYSWILESVPSHKNPTSIYGSVLRKEIG